MIFFWEKLLRRRCVAMSNSFPSRMNHLNILNYSSLSVGQLPSISIHRVIFHEKWWCSVEQFMKIHWKFWIIPLNTWWFSIEHVDFAWKFHSKMVKFPFFHGFFMDFSWRFGVFKRGCPEASWVPPRVPSSVACQSLTCHRLGRDQWSRSSAEPKYSY